MAGSDHRIVGRDVREGAGELARGALRVGPRRCTRLSRAKPFTPTKRPGSWTIRCGATTGVCSLDGRHRPGCRRIGAGGLVARTFVDESNGERVLTLPSGARELWSSVAHFDGQEWASHVDARHSDLRVAVGASGYQWKDSLAVIARRSPRSAWRSVPGARRVSPSTEDVPCLLTEDLGELRELVARELKALAGADGVTTRIRDTVRVYYENNCTAAATAAALGLHKNTVRYRLDQAEKLLGR